MKVFVASAAVLLATAVAQQVGTLQTETHPALTSQTCTASGCTTEQTKIVIDANWRWLHKVGASSNCYSGNKWDATVCPDNKQCAANCALEGSDYSGTYGISTSGSSVKLGFVTKHAYGTNIGSRVYLMDTDTTYKNFKLLNREFAFDTDVSKLPCGLNGALYFVQMDMDGGMARFPTNKAGAKYGTGYCDAQCARDLKFISGAANVEGWAPSSNDANAGQGGAGSCCPEMDIWEANSISNAYTSHPCSVDGQTKCTGDVQCGTGSNRYSGFCDMDGCDFNPFRLGDKTFFGPGMKVDTNKPMTVVTRFVTSDGTDNGDLVKIERFYIQNGVTIANSNIAQPSVDAVNSLTDKVCSQTKVAFGDNDDHKTKGGLVKMGAAMKKGMVLVMSLWDDHAANCLWLDSSYPTDKSPSIPGVMRGTCPTTSGVPADVEANSPGATVSFSNIKVGTIGSIIPSGPTSAPIPTTTTPKPTATVKPTVTPKPTKTTVKPTTTPTPTGGSAAQKYAQCGGIGWSGATACVSGSTCTKVNDYYFQCL